MKRRGSLLEETLGSIFEKAGFDVSINSKEFGFESDVIARISNFTILVQTKQYENSYINIRDLLHEWSSKGKTAGADRTVVVIWGIPIQEKYYTEAKKLGVYLLGEKEISKLQKLDKKKLYSELCLMLGFGKLIKLIEMVEDSYISPQQHNEFIERIRDGIIGKREPKKEIINAEKSHEAHMEQIRIEKINKLNEIKKAKRIEIEFKINFKNKIIKR